MTVRKFSIVLFLCLLFPAVAHAGSLDETFQKANEAFWKGNFEAANEKYTELEEFGVSSYELYFNRATAEARLGRPGVAIQYYEKALRLQPGDEDALFNLGILRDYIARRANEKGRDADLAPAIGPTRALLDRFSSHGAAISFLVFLFAAFSALFVRRFFRAEMARLSSGVICAVLLILTLFTGLLTLGKWIQATSLHEAVVIAPETTSVTEGPRSTVLRFSLEEGSRVQILEHRGEWMKIRDDQGRDGWSLRENLGRI